MNSKQEYLTKRCKEIYDSVILHFNAGSYMYIYRLHKDYEKVTDEILEKIKNDSENFDEYIEFQKLMLPIQL